MATDDHSASGPADPPTDDRASTPIGTAAFEAYESESLPQAAAGSTGKAGELSLTFAADSDGRTRLVRDFATVPFHLPGGLTHDEQVPDLATVYVQSPTGGIAQGDRHAVDVTVGTNATAHVTTQSAEKVLRMERNCARTDVHLDVAEGGYLEYLPEPTILYPDARYRQETTLTVGDDATAVVGETVVPGRLARGEVFEFERLYSRFTVEGPDGLLVQDTTDLHPAARDPRRAGVMGSHRVLGTLYVVGEPSLSDRLHDRVAAVEDVRGGATALPNGAGVLVRALGDRPRQVSRALDAAWDETRRAVLAAGAPARRKD